jgi:hypothetical protein
MKRWKIFFILGFLLEMTCSVYASETSVTDLQGKLETENQIFRRAKVFFRGVVNIATLPLEVPRTVIEERKRNPENWEWSLMPRTLENVVGRGLSAVNDSVFLAFMKSPDASSEPWTRQWELPDYPWKENKNFKKKDRANKHDYFTMIRVRG